MKLNKGLLLAIFGSIFLGGCSYNEDGVSPMKDSSIPQKQVRAMASLDDNIDKLLGYDSNSSINKTEVLLYSKEFEEFKNLKGRLGELSKKAFGIYFDSDDKSGFDDYYIEQMSIYEKRKDDLFHLQGNPILLEKIVEDMKADKDREVVDDAMLYVFNDALKMRNRNDEYMSLIYWVNYGDIDFVKFYMEKNSIENDDFLYIMNCDSLDEFIDKDKDIIQIRAKMYCDIKISKFSKIYENRKNLAEKNMRSISSYLHIFEGIGFSFKYTSKGIVVETLDLLEDVLIEEENKTPKEDEKKNDNNHDKRRPYKRDPLLVRMYPV